MLFIATSFCLLSCFGFTVAAPLDERSIALGSFIVKDGDLPPALQAYEDENTRLKVKYSSQSSCTASKTSKSSKKQKTSKSAASKSSKSGSKHKLSSRGRLSWPHSDHRKISTPPPTDYTSSQIVCSVVWFDLKGAYHATVPDPV